MNLLERVNYASRVIREGRNTSRRFDNCFEEGDGGAVVTALVLRSKRSERLAKNLPRYVCQNSIDKAKAGLYANRTKIPMLTFKCSKLERQKITKIVERAIQYDPALDYLNTATDITAAHANGCALDLDKLLGFPDADFMHDVYGISDHIDRYTGKLTGCFDPRCSMPQLTTD